MNGYLFSLPSGQVPIFFSLWQFSRYFVSGRRLYNPKRSLITCLLFCRPKRKRTNQLFYTAAAAASFVNNEHVLRSLLLTRLLSVLHFAAGPSVCVYVLRIQQHLPADAPVALDVPTHPHTHTRPVVKCVPLEHPARYAFKRKFIYL